MIAPQIDLRTMRVRVIGSGQIAVAERNVVEPRAAEISTHEYRRLEPRAREPGDSKVGVVEPAVVAGGRAERRVPELRADPPAVDETNPVKHRLQEVATREVATH